MPATSTFSSAPSSGMLAASGTRGARSCPARSAPPPALARRHRLQPNVIGMKARLPIVLAAEHGDAARQGANAALKDGHGRPGAATRSSSRRSTRSSTRSAAWCASSSTTSASSRSPPTSAPRSTASRFTALPIFLVRGFHHGAILVQHEVGHPRARRTSRAARRRQPRLHGHDRRLGARHPRRRVRRRPRPRDLGPVGRRARGRVPAAGERRPDGARRDLARPARRAASSRRRSASRSTTRTSRR